MNKAEKLKKLKYLRNPNLEEQEILNFLASRIEIMEVETPTPKKGIDYFTEDDINRVANLVKTMIRDGVDGEDGDVGPQGERGEKGDVGPQGEIGPRGKDGVDGETPNIDKALKEALSKIPKDKPVDTKLFIQQALEAFREEYKDDSLKLTALEKRLVRLGGGGASFITQLLDQAINNPTEGQVLAFNETLQKWENRDGGTGGGAVDSVNGQTGAVVLDADDISDTTTTNKFSTTAEKDKLGFISVTQAVDLDTMESDIAGKENTSNKNLSNTGYAGVQDFSGLGYSGILRLFGYDQHNPQEQMDGWHVSTVDPTSAEDNTAGYMLWDKIINTTNSTIWLATSVGTGTATWQQISLTDISSKEDVANKNAVGGYLGLENSITPLRLYTNALADNPLTQTDGIHRRGVAPTITDDSSAGYIREDIWITSAGIWVCTDNTTGAAVWTQTSSGGGGGSGLTFAQVYSLSTLQI